MLWGKIWVSANTSLRKEFQNWLHHTKLPNASTGKPPPDTSGLLLPSPGIRPAEAPPGSPGARTTPAKIAWRLWRVPVTRSWIYGVRQYLHNHCQGFSPCLVFPKRAQGSPVMGDAKIPTGSWDAENTNQFSGSLVSAPSVWGVHLRQELPPSLSKACWSNKRRGSHRTQSNPTSQADDPKDGPPICMKRQWSKLRAPVWLRFEASDAAAAPLGGG